MYVYTIKAAQRHIFDSRDSKGRWLLYAMHPRKADVTKDLCGLEPIILVQLGRAHDHYTKSAKPVEKNIYDIILEFYKIMERSG